MPTCNWIQYQWIAWGFAALMFLLFVVWSINLRNIVLFYLDKLDNIISNVEINGDIETPKEYAERLRRMTPEDLELEVQRYRNAKKFVKEIVQNLEGLRASLPFMGRR
jgi:hypothetical protein